MVRPARSRLALSAFVAACAVLFSAVLPGCADDPDAAPPDDPNAQPGGLAPGPRLEPGGRLEPGPSLAPDAEFRPGETMATSPPNAADPALLARAAETALNLDPRVTAATVTFDGAVVAIDAATALPADSLPALAALLVRRAAGAVETGTSGAERAGRTRHTYRVALRGAAGAAVRGGKAPGAEAVRLE